MSEPEHASDFELTRGFHRGAVTGGVELGQLAAEYGELFADAIRDGVITGEERGRLDEAAESLGINPGQLAQLELAMLKAYETHHHVKVIEGLEAPLSALDALSADADPVSTRPALLARIELLNRRVQALEEELREARSQVNVEVDLTGLAASEALGDESADQLRARIRRDPTNPELFARLYQAFAEAGDRDGEYCAAQALLLLGVANPAQTDLVATHQPKGLIAPERALSVDDWNGALLHPELELVTGHILSLITPAALMGRVAGLRREKKLLALPDALKQDPKQSTVMAVRALAWAATVLGMPTPSIYADVEREVAFQHVLDVPPYTLVGKGALAGRTQMESAFLAARHMTHYRAEFFVKVLAPGLGDLEDLFLAALLIASPGLPLAAHVRARVAPISNALEPMLDAERKDAVRQQFKAFVADGGRTNLLRYKDSVDKTACRAGLLLSGDLGCAARLLASEEGPEGPLRADLLSFVISDRHAQLRRRLGIAVE